MRKPATRERTIRNGKFLEANSAWTILAPALLGSAVLLLYGRTLGGYFIADDFGYVSLFANLPIRQWPELFVREWSLGIWGFQLPELRPVPAFSFILDALVWRGQAFGYRLTNLLLHLACTYMVFAIGVQLLRLRKPIAFVAAFFFAVHPCHAVPVVWITGRVDLLPPLFCLAGLLAFDRFRKRSSLLALIVSYICYFAAAFSKEYGLVLPLLIASYDISRAHNQGSAPSGRPNWLRSVAPYSGYVVILGIYYACRHLAFEGEMAPPRLPPWWHVVGQQIEYWRYLLGLDGLAAGRLFSWRPGASVTLQSFVALGAFAVLIMLAAVVPAIRRDGAPSTRRLLFCGPVWFLLTTIPFIITYTSPRHLYLASAGFCLFLAALLGTAYHGQRSRTRFLVTAALLTLAWSFETYQQLRPWEHAGAITKRVAAELRRLEKSSSGTVLVLDLPTDTAGGAYVFAWSSPFLLDRPFLKKNLRERLIVLESPRTYYTPVRWNQKPEIAQVLGLPGEITAFALDVDASAEDAKLRPLEGERLREAVRSLHDEIERNPAQDSQGLWAQFRSRL